MRLVPADYISVEDREVQSVLETHPLVKAYLALLLNGYRELCLMAFEAMHEGERDTADGYISLSKKDTRVLRFGLPLCENMEDWQALRRELRPGFPAANRSCRYSGTVKTPTLTWLQRCSDCLTIFFGRTTKAKMARRNK